VLAGLCLATTHHMPYEMSACGPNAIDYLNLEVVASHASLTYHYYQQFAEPGYIRL
jgi:hypothetical protein